MESFLGTVVKKCGNCGREYKTDKDFLSYTTRWRQCSEGNLWVNCNCGSTIVLPKGKYDWFAPENKMSTQANSVFNQLSKDKEIPHLDSQVMRITELLSQEEFSLEELTAAIKRDPLIATDVLSVANNLKVAGISQIDSIKHAIVYIGRETLKEIVMIAGLKKMEIDTTTFVLEDYWQDSLATGFIAEKLVTRFAPHLIPDEAYIAGCLANIGKLLLALLFPTVADEIVENIYGEEVPTNWAQVETREKTPTHTILGEIAGVMWGMPEYVVDICAFHHTQEKLFKGDPGTPLTLLDIVSTAVQMNHIMQVESQVAQVDTIKGFIKHVKITRREFDSLVLEMKTQIRSKGQLGVA